MTSKYDLKKQPLQERSKFMVNVIKQAAAHILKDEGCGKFTTNRVAEKAGVSIGSLYQYFPSKKALIAEIKRDHFNQLREFYKNAYDNSRRSSLSVIAGSLINASINAHRLDPALHKILNSDLSEFKIREDDKSEESIRLAVKDLLREHKSELRDNINSHLAADIIYKVVERIIHDAAIADPGQLENNEIADELHLLIMTYLTTQRDEP